MRLRLALATAVLLSACSEVCRPGEAGCACVAQTCRAGLTCVEGACRGESRTGLRFDTRARACEVLLGETGGRIERVLFAPSVIGKWLRQGDKVAASFISDGDAPLGGVEVAYAGASAAASFEILRSHCYGADGQELAGAMVRR